MKRGNEPDLATHLEEAASVIAGHVPGFTPQLALVLGSGLGFVAQGVTDAVRIPATRLPHYPHSSVPGHAGCLVLGTLAGVPVICQQGRVHYYEGHEIETVVFPVRLMARVGARTLLLTSAVGSLRRGAEPGDFLVIRDHLNLMAVNPLRGAAGAALGERFLDLTATYDRDLLEVAEAAAAEVGVSLRRATLAAVAGPTYETPAEIAYLSRLGADAVGMSLVPEAIAARQLGMRVLALSVVTNYAAGVSEQALSHEEVLQTGEAAKEPFGALVRAVVARLRHATR